MSENKDERRRTPRHEVRVITEIDSSDSGESAIGVLREISVSGGRFLTNTKFADGERLHLGVHFDPDDDSTVGILVCRVVRSSTVAASRGGVWQHEIAVRFEEGVDEVANEIVALGKALEDQLA